MTFLPARIYVQHSETVQCVVVKKKKKINKEKRRKNRKSWQFLITFIVGCSKCHILFPVEGSCDQHVQVFPDQSHQWHTQWEYTFMT
jgi:hypothetical protein